MEKYGKTTMTINPVLKARIVDALRNVKNAFDDRADLAGKVMEKKVPITHFLAIERIKAQYDPVISDLKLAMLCGTCDFVFSAGDFGYTPDQNRALNALGDAIFDLKNT